MNEEAKNMYEETQNTGVELPDEDIAKATGGAGPLQEYKARCSACGYS